MHSYNAGNLPSWTTNFVQKCSSSCLTSMVTTVAPLSFLQGSGTEGGALGIQICDNDDVMCSL